MAKRSTMNISVTLEMEKFVTGLVKSGQYQSASEVLRDALRILLVREKEREAHLRELRRELAKGSRSIARGDIYDAGDVFAELDRRHAANARRRRKSA